MVTINGTTGVSMVQDDAVNPVTDIASGIPCFSAYANVLTSITSVTWTKVNFQVEEFDTTNNYNNSVSRFTPTIAGYYSVHASAMFSAVSYNSLGIFKNGVHYKNGSTSGNSANATSAVDSIVYFDGVSDYIEIHAWCSATVNTVVTAAAYCKFQAHLIVGA